MTLVDFFFLCVLSATFMFFGIGLYKGVESLFTKLKGVK
jgi:hypothetical protein